MFTLNGANGLAVAALALVLLHGLNLFSSSWIHAVACLTSWLAANAHCCLATITKEN